MEKSLNRFFRYFKIPFVIGFFSLILAASVGYYYSGTLEGASKALFLCAVLSLLEISLSFDNAIVNAVILKQMSPPWQRRFLTLGILIAVFGLRFIFPLILIGVIARISPFAALMMAIKDPPAFAKLMISAHISVSAFGGSFLMMVALKYFFKKNKEVYWIGMIERPLSVLGKVETFKISFNLIFIYFFSRFLPEVHQEEFLTSALWGTIIFLIVDSLGDFLHRPDQKQTSVDLQRQSIGLFIYLEVLDASFSFDGVIGAFAISNNLFIIMIGLGVGAMFVRSTTILFIRTGTMQKYPFLKPGAFYAIGALSIIMFLNTIMEISEVFSGLIGILLICSAVISSIRFNKKH